MQSNSYLFMDQVQFDHRLFFTRASLTEINMQLDYTPRYTLVVYTHIMTRLNGSIPKLLVVGIWSIESSLENCKSTTTKQDKNYTPVSTGKTT